MVIKFFLFLFSISAPFYFSQVSGEERDTSAIYELSEVLVTATKTERSSLELASSASVIDSAEIALSKKITIYDLLKNEYGLTLTRQGGPGSLSYLYMRGSGSGHTLVLIDGIEVNMPNETINAFDYANLPVDNVERIEIIRGPQSTLYGSDALGGVINVITAKGGGKTKFSLSAEGGSFGTYRGLASLNGSVNIFNYSLSLGRFKTDGISAASEKYGNTEKDGSSRDMFTSRIGTNITEDLDLNFLFRFTRADAELDRSGGVSGDDPTYFFDLEEGAYRGEINYSAFDNIWTQTLGVSFFRNVRKYKYDSTELHPSSSTSFYDGRKIKLDWQNNFYFFGNIITIGAETEEEKAETEFYSFSDASTFVSLFPKKSSRTSGIYLQDQVKYDQSLFLTMGGRFDHHEKFGWHGTFRIAPAFIIWQTGTKIRAVYGTGFKTPSLFYLFDPFFGNPGLEPEKSSGWEAGIEQYFTDNKTILGLTYFSNSFKDLFGLDEMVKAVNIDKAETRGIEFYLTSNPFKDVHLKTNFTYTDAKNRNRNSEDYNKPLLRRPEIKAGGSISYSFNEETAVNTEVVYTGPREDLDFSVFPASRVTLKSYTLVNFSVSYDILEYLQLFGRIDNILDEEYEDILGYGAPGISVYAGVKLGI